MQNFFCSSLDFEQKIGIVFICVDLCGVRNNKLLNLGVRYLKKVESHCIIRICFNFILHQTGYVSTIKLSLFSGAMSFKSMK